MTKGLEKYFPMIRSREEILEEIRDSDSLSDIFDSWNAEQRTLFLDCCSGVRGIKLLYDSFFKEIMDPELKPKRLEELLSLILLQKVTILKVLPNESPRIADEKSLLIMDIVIELEDGSIANVEVQKFGYNFPGQRAACYSADLLLRQYKRVKEDEPKNKNFNYRKIKKFILSFCLKKALMNFIILKKNISTDSNKNQIPESNSNYCRNSCS